MDRLLAYALDLSPWLALIAIAFVLVPRSAPLARTAVAILGFILLRDTMTTHELWRIGSADGMLWIRFIDDPAALLSMACLSAILTAAICWGMGRRARDSMRVWGAGRAASAAWGLGGAVVVLVPMLVLQAFADVPLEQRGGAMSTLGLAALLVFAIAGNALEEVIFRGFLQGALDGPGWRTALASGAVFAAGHIFLATLVTDVGWPLVAFTLLEGVVCGFVWLRAGLVGSTVTHGLTIAVLASGLL